MRSGKRAARSEKIRHATPRRFCRRHFFRRLAFSAEPRLFIYELCARRAAAEHVFKHRCHVYEAMRMPATMIRRRYADRDEEQNSAAERQTR